MFRVHQHPTQITQSPRLSKVGCGSTPSKRLKSYREMQYIDSVLNSLGNDQTYHISNKNWQIESREQGGHRVQLLAPSEGQYLGRHQRSE